MAPGGKPVTALPGETPRSPVMVVAPVFVTVEPPSTAKLCAAPSVGAVSSSLLACPPTGTAMATTKADVAIPQTSIRRVHVTKSNMICSDPLKSTGGTPDGPLLQNGRNDIK